MENKPSFLQPIGRNHSDMVKYSEYDDDGGIVSSLYIRVVKLASAVIRDKTTSLEEPSTSFPSTSRRQLQNRKPRDSKPGRSIQKSRWKLSAEPRSSEEVQENNSTKRKVLTIDVRRVIATQWWRNKHGPSHLGLESAQEKMTSKSLLMPA